MPSEIGSLDTTSVIPLEGSIRVSAAISDTMPVKTRAGDIDLKLDNIQKKLNELHNKRNENWEVETEWERKQAEIFSTAGAGGKKSSRKERKLLERLEFLKKMAHPKRQRIKIVTDGIPLSYHAQMFRSGRDKPG